MNSPENCIVKALGFIQKAASIIVDCDISMFVSSAVAYEFNSAKYQKSYFDSSIREKLKNIDIIRDNVDKLRDMLATWHPDVNFVQESDGITSINSLVSSVSHWVSDLNKTVTTVSVYSKKNQEAKLAILTACKTCREAYLGVNIMIKTYNEGMEALYQKKLRISMRKGTQKPLPFTKIDSLLIPEQISLTNEPSELAKASGLSFEDEQYIEDLLEEPVFQEDELYDDSGKEII
jgi:hypothetical protein